VASAPGSAGKRSALSLSSIGLALRARRFSSSGAGLSNTGSCPADSRSGKDRDHVRTRRSGNRSPGPGFSGGGDFGTSAVAPAAPGTATGQPVARFPGAGRASRTGMAVKTVVTHPRLLGSCWLFVAPADLLRYLWRHVPLLVSLPHGRRRQGTG